MLEVKNIEKVGKICYNTVICGADKTKSKEIAVIGIAAFVIAIAAIIKSARVPMPLLQNRRN